MHISKPNSSDYPAYYATYINKVTSEDLLAELENNFIKTEKLIYSLTDEQLNYRYAEGKWSIKEVLLHIMDSERIFAYRALRFARQDKTALPGYEENEYAPLSKAAARSGDSIMKEFAALRKSSIELIKNFDEEQLNQSGIANGKQITVRALVYIIAGHELHHMQVISERYL